MDLRVDKIIMVKFGNLFRIKHKLIDFYHVSSRLMLGPVAGVSPIIILSGGNFQRTAIAQAFPIPQFPHVFWYGARV